VSALVNKLTGIVIDSVLPATSLALIRPDKQSSFTKSNLQRKPLPGEPEAPFTPIVVSVYMAKFVQNAALHIKVELLGNSDSANL